MTEPRISCTTKDSTRAEQACDQRARAWALVFATYRQKKEAAPESRPDDGTKVKEDSANEHRST